MKNLLSTENYIFYTVNNLYQQGYKRHGNSRSLKTGTLLLSLMRKNDVYLLLLFIILAVTVLSIIFFVIL